MNLERKVGDITFKYSASYDKAREEKVDVPPAYPDQPQDEDKLQACFPRFSLVAIRDFDVWDLIVQHDKLPPMVQAAPQLLVTAITLFMQAGEGVTHQLALTNRGLELSLTFQVLEVVSTTVDLLLVPRARDGPGNSVITALQAKVIALEKANAALLSRVQLIEGSSYVKISKMPTDEEMYAFIHVLKEQDFREMTGEFAAHFKSLTKFMQHFKERYPQYVDLSQTLTSGITRSKFCKFLTDKATLKKALHIMTNPPQGVYPIYSLLIALYFSFFSFSKSLVPPSNFTFSKDKFETNMLIEFQYTKAPEGISWSWYRSLKRSSSPPADADAGFTINEYSHDVRIVVNDKCFRFVRECRQRQ